MLLSRLINLLLGLIRFALHNEQRAAIADESKDHLDLLSCELVLWTANDEEIELLQFI